MSYSTVDTSDQDGEVVYYHEFNTQLGQYRYNTSSAIRTLNGFSWLPLPATHTVVAQSSEMEKNSITVGLPRSASNTLDTDFAEIAPRGSYTMFRGFLSGTGETIVNYKGLIVSQKRSRTEQKITVENLYTGMRRSALSDRYSRNCRHSVYNLGCNLSRSDFRVSGSVILLDGKTVTVSAASSQSDGYFNGGIIEMPDGESAMITTHVGSLLTLHSVPDYLQVELGTGTVPVSLYPGCDKTIKTCVDVFDNLVNNGGFKYIPNKNAFNGGSIR